MLDNRHNSSCPHEEQIVSYLYREMPPAEIDKFESHLAVCGSCVDELAALSEPHLAVYEWRTNVFNRIPAPSVRLSFVEEHQPRTEGLLGRLTAILAGWPAGLRVGVGFAALLAVGFSVFLLTRSPGISDVAQNLEVPHHPIARESVVESAQPPVVGLPAANEVSRVPDDASEPVRKVVRVKERVKTTVKATTARTGRSEFAANLKEKTTKQRTLRLNNFEEDEDTTLRLAELLEEVGSL
jgi:hypothetical protein